MWTQELWEAPISCHVHREIKQASLQWERTMNSVYRETQRGKAEGERCSGDPRSSSAGSYGPAGSLWPQGSWDAPCSHNKSCSLFRLLQSGFYNCNQRVLKHTRRCLIAYCVCSVQESGGPGNESLGTKQWQVPGNFSGHQYLVPFPRGVIRNTLRILEGILV